MNCGQLAAKELTVRVPDSFATNGGGLDVKRFARPMPAFSPVQRETNVPRVVALRLDSIVRDLEVRMRLSEQKRRRRSEAQGWLLLKELHRIAPADGTISRRRGLKPEHKEGSSSLTQNCSSQKTSSVGHSARRGPAERKKIAAAAA
jgi:hypothetical protein